MVTPLRMLVVREDWVWLLVDGCLTATGLILEG
jgi:hypothetical protein